MRMADAELLPYQYTAVAETIAGYVKDLKTELSKPHRRRSRSATWNSMRATFSAISDPHAAYLTLRSVSRSRRFLTSLLWIMEWSR